MNPATIDGATIRLRKQGGGTDVPATVSYAGTTATLDPDADLDPGATYEVTVAGSVEDVSGNALGADDTWTFTTAGLSLIDTTSADFGAGTTGADTYVSQTDDGEVTLKPAEGAEFEGGSLPRRLDERPVVGGRRRHRLRRPPARRRRQRRDDRHLRGRAARSSSPPPSPRRPFQTVGFATDLNAPPWATSAPRATACSTPAPTTAPSPPRRRCPRACSAPRTATGSSGTRARCRFFVDDALVATHTVELRPDRCGR